MAKWARWQEVQSAGDHRSPFSEHASIWLLRSAYTSFAMRES